MRFKCYFVSMPISISISLRLCFHLCLSIPISIFHSKPVACNWTSVTSDNLTSLVNDGAIDQNELFCEKFHFSTNFSNL